MASDGRAQDWTVLLVGGAAGTGKSKVSYPLGRRLGVPVLEIDDIVQALLAMTTPQQQPALHYWHTHPEAASLPPRDILQLHLATCAAIAPAIEAVIANHLDTDMPVIIEGDHLTPELAARTQFCGFTAGRRVRAVMIAEQDEDQIVANFQAREGAEQRGRAQVSALHTAWLTEQAHQHGIPMLPSRPWHASLDRLHDGFFGPATEAV